MFFPGEVPASSDKAILSFGRGRLLTHSAAEAGSTFRGNGCVSLKVDMFLKWLVLRIVNLEKFMVLKVGAEVSHATAADLPGFAHSSAGALHLWSGACRPHQELTKVSPGTGSIAYRKLGSTGLRPFWRDRAVLGGRCLQAWQLV